VSTDQEYDAQQSQSMLDHVDQQDVGEASDTSPTQLQGSYPPQFDQAQQQQQAPPPQPPQEYYQQSFGAQPSVQQHNMQPQQQYAEQQQPAPQAMAASQPQQAPQSAGGQFGMSSIIDPNDPMLDADPFGLSASMHYPTAYSALDHPQNAR
jgi:hypothetical protein